ncbi:MAG: SPOR domain-containing protein, partial [Acidobacteriota bacterium]|nr:SPOR domain-containing protein [Acidobacteriota bacterium]
AKAKAAGFAAQIVKEKGAYKVRWNHAGTKPDVDAAATRMKAAGFKPFAVPVE